jgi:hypothetical protein
MARTWRSLCMALCSLLLMVALMVPPARAEDRIVVRAGESVVIARTPKPIMNERVNLGSVAKAEQETRPVKTYVLVYIPPVGATQIEDTVQYTVDGQLVTVPISVRSHSPTLADSALYETSFKALFVLFILAVLVENGLALIFRWRPFLDYFDSRTVNALFAFGFSLFFVYLFDLDVSTTLVNTYSGTNHPVNWPGLVLTALIIAGGSAGINRIFQALGFRPAGSQEEAVATPPRTEAWIAVTLIRDQAVGPVNVMIGPPGAPAVAGTISGTTRGRSWWRWLLRNKGRFPPGGGHRVAPGGPYEVTLTGMNNAGQPVSSATWGPRTLAPGALVDIELLL